MNYEWGYQKQTHQSIQTLPRYRQQRRHNCRAIYGSQWLYDQSIVWETSLFRELMRYMQQFIPSYFDLK